MNQTAISEQDAPPTETSFPVHRVPRILLVGPSLRIMGGQAVMADRMIRAMQADGVDIDFQPINPEPPSWLKWAEEIKGLRTLVISFFYVTALLRRVPRYDVVHLFSASYLSFIISQTPAILIAWMYRKPLILNYRSGEAEDHLQTWGASISWILRLCSRIVTPSDYLVDVFAKFGFPATSVFNVIDPQAIRYRLRKSAEPHILVPRSLEPLYNVGCAIKAFAIVKESFPKATLTVLGDGSQRDELQDLVAQLKLDDVTFAGRVERRQIGEYYDHNDILLNTTSIDNMPVSVLEGFAAGLPIVTTDAGGIPYLITDRQNGHMVPVNDHAQAAARMIELLGQPEQVEQLSRNSQSEVKKYLWENVARRWYQLYIDVCK